MGTHELVEIDRETGEETELYATGTLDRMTEAAEEIAQQSDDDGQDTPWLRVQPRS